MKKFIAIVAVLTVTVSGLIAMVAAKPALPYLIDDVDARRPTTPGALAQAVDPAMARRIHDRLKEIGFKYVALDLLGYRTGSMNEPLGLSGI